MMINRHRVLVIGVGGIGQVHVEALLDSGRAEVGICDFDENALLRLEQKFHVRGFNSLDTALEQPWDAAVVATPAHSHLEIGLRLTEMGISVLVEKPLALVPDGLKDWAEAATRMNVPVMVGFVFRCHPILLALRRELQNGRIGRPLQIVSQRGGHLPSRRPDYISNYYRDRSTGGGVVQDILSHVLNATEWLVGPVDQVMASAAHLQLPGVEVDDTVSVIARHGPVLASYTVNQHQYVAEFRLDIHGTTGSLRADFGKNYWAMADQPDGAWVKHTMPLWSKSQWFGAQANCFLDVVEHRMSSPCSLADALQTIHSIQATLKSSMQIDAWTKPASA